MPSTIVLHLHEDRAAALVGGPAMRALAGLPGSTSCDPLDAVDDHVLDQVEERVHNLLDDGVVAFDSFYGHLVEPPIPSNWPAQRHDAETARNSLTRTIRAQVPSPRSPAGEALDMPSPRRCSGWLRGSAWISARVSGQLTNPSGPGC